ncbi:cytochrome c (plasmid) [Rhizobium sp. TRM96647]|uniref:c-type cytochrome n=1 Tax=unclassified Rhizobium TaxID=2613769 RepID=UPI0021E80AA4|nr:MULTISPECIES: cytochrome c [unclassified Rhizobium]MCV3735641.1 cytochrome c [Rhizobium sp. TRM96647]MCV3757596.1 cytochrome c [Rhizobium sp. TRM96650]
MNLKTIAAATFLCLGAAAATGVAVAQEPQAARQQMMKDVGRSMGALAGIAKGEKPYDAEVVRVSLATISEVSKTFPDQFPAGTETGAETEASPKIWENPDDFHAKSLQLGKDADAALAALPGDQAAVAAAIGPIGKNCGACHETYRIKK